MGSLRVVVAVSRDRSDLYFANQLMQRLNVVGVLVENQWPEPDRAPLLLKAARLLTQPHRLVGRAYQSILRRWRTRFAIYNREQYLTDFGEQGLSINSPGNRDIVYTSGVNAINEAEYVEWLRKMAPDVVAVCGTSILRAEFLTVPRKGVLNLHGGLSQRYRGLNTTDWAVHNAEPEYIGATVHFVAPGVDDGDIVYQGRPWITADDTPNTLYVKVVKLGVEMMEAAIREIETGTLTSRPLHSPGQLYRARDFTDRIRAKTWRQYDRGCIRHYTEHRAARDAKVDREIINEFADSADYARRRGS